MSMTEVGVGRNVAAKSKVSLFFTEQSQENSEK